MSLESTLIVLFVIATAVAIAARWLEVPYTVALVIVGLVMGTTRLIAPPHLTKQLLFDLILPGLIFEASFHVDFGALRRNAGTVAALAVPGVIVSIALTGAIAVLAIRLSGGEQGFSLEYGIIFGALIAATDPIAVVALFRQSHAPLRLATLIEGESLLNDGTSIVFLTLILSYVAGTTTGAGPIAARFCLIVAGGAVVGGLVGGATSLVTKQLDDPMVEITLTMIAAYGSFALADGLELSGVIATVTAGLICGNYTQRVAMSAATLAAVTAFWEYVSFALNSIVFLLIGFEVPIGSLTSSWEIIGLAYLAALVGRVFVIGGVMLLSRGSSEPIPPRWGVVLAWGGLRGALAMVLALGLPPELPHRAILVTMTFGVVIASLIAQGLTVSWLLRRLALVGGPPRP